ncbi:MAG: transposase domain-containing protein [Planctomycetaceae bacterium]|nr:transposase domain-containing protein [Planctomycetaceae bacterium]
MICLEDIRSALTATGRVSTQSCVLTSEVIPWVMLAMGLLNDLPIRQVFTHARWWRKGEESPGGVARYAVHNNRR